MGLSACTEMISQVRESSRETRDGLKAHPLSLPQIKVSELESGWLVDAFNQRFPDIGGSCNLCNSKHCVTKLKHCLTILAGCSQRPLLCISHGSL